MRKIIVKAKFSPKGKLICASQVKCVACDQNKKCEEIELFIKGPFEDPEDCMSERTYKRKHGRIVQAKTE